MELYKLKTQRIRAEFFTIRGLIDVDTKVVTITL